ncbi:MAG: hypothetical protein J6S82_03895 [Bacteroidales bacterium]|nr:hypothetical protein [Bacteroidales bacterium]
MKHLLKLLLLGMIFGCICCGNSETEKDATENISKTTDTLYHLLDDSVEEPLVMEWNVSRQKAVSSKNYIMEVSDSSGRPVALYFYYHGLNRRQVIDDPEIILFTYNGKSVDIYTNHSPETDCSMWADEDFRCLHYHVVFDDIRRITDYSVHSFVDTLRMKEYYQEMKLEYNNKEQDCILLEEYHGLESCNDIEVPYMQFSYRKFPTTKNDGK